jgi:hypothetical protein
MPPTSVPHCPKSGRQLSRGAGANRRSAPWLRSSRGDALAVAVSSAGDRSTTDGRRLPRRTDARRLEAALADGPGERGGRFSPSHTRRAVGAKSRTPGYAGAGPGAIIESTRSANVSAPTRSWRRRHGRGVSQARPQTAARRRNPAAGERPFNCDAGVSVIASILKDAPKRLSDARPGLPRNLERMVRRALATSGSIPRTRCSRRARASHYRACRECPDPKRRGGHQPHTERFGQVRLAMAVTDL